MDSAEKPSAHPSTKLRANGGGIEIIDVFPFMLSMSKHERSLFQQNPYEYTTLGIAIEIPAFFSADS